MSVGELAITPSISLVAVCCSNASVSSWNRRTFSMAITAWEANVSSNLIWFSVNGRTSWRWIAIAPIRTFSFRSGTARFVFPHAFLFIGFRHNAFRIGEHVGNMNQAVFQVLPDATRSLALAGSACFLYKLAMRRKCYSPRRPERPLHQI